MGVEYVEILFLFSIG